MLFPNRNGVLPRAYSLPERPPFSVRTPPSLKHAGPALIYPPSASSQLGEVLGVRHTAHTPHCYSISIPLLTCRCRTKRNALCPRLFQARGANPNIVQIARTHKPSCVCHKVPVCVANHSLAGSQGPYSRANSLVTVCPILQDPCAELCSLRCTQVLRHKFRFSSNHPYIH